MLSKHVTCMTLLRHEMRYMMRCEQDT